MGIEPLSGDDPAQVADYTLRARLGAGGMGRVYLAYTPGGRPVALKMVRTEFIADQDFRERFRREADAARRVHGLYTAQVLDADPDGTPPWLVTAYVPGPSLQEAIGQHGPMPPQSVFQLMAGVAEALGAIHAAGVVHRDLKPSNVLLAQDGPRVIDFGIAQAADASALTRQGMHVGSPQFMAPEQILGHPPTAAIDIFALGHLAAYALLGRSPFGIGDPAAVFPRILHQAPDLGDCPVPLRELIEWCMSKDPGARPTPAQVVATCRVHQAPHTAWVTDTWLPPAMAASLAAHAAPPPRQPFAQPPTVQPPRPAPPTMPQPTLYGAPTPGGTRIYLPRSPRTRAAAAVLIIAALVGVAILLLHGRGNAHATTTLGSTPATVPGTTGATQAAAHSASSSPTSSLDPCLFGTWTGVTEDSITTINLAPVQFTGKGPTQTFHSDGSETVDYGTGTDLNATANGEPWLVKFSGSATGQWETRGGMLYHSNIVANGTQTIYENGIYNASGPLTIDPAPSSYTCSGNTLRIYASQGSLVLTRASH